MAGGTRDHGQVVRRITRLIEDQLDLAIWTVLNDRGVETRDTTRYQDICVEPADEAGNSLSTQRPVLLVEVLSPSTTVNHLDVKPEEFMSLPSLDAYIVASQDEPAMLLWQRGQKGRFPMRTREVRGLGEVLSVATRAGSFALPFAVVYRGIA